MGGHPPRGWDRAIHSQGIEQTRLTMQHAVVAWRSGVQSSDGSRLLRPGHCARRRTGREYVPLTINAPVVTLSPAKAIVHNPAVNAIQKLRLRPPRCPRTGSGVVAFSCVTTDERGPFRTRRSTVGRAPAVVHRWGHATSADLARARQNTVCDVGDRKLFTTSGTTGVVVRSGKCSMPSGRGITRPRTALYRLLSVR